MSSDLYFTEVITKAYELAAIRFPCQYLIFVGHRQIDGIDHDAVSRRLSSRRLRRVGPEEPLIIG